MQNWMIEQILSFQVPSGVTISPSGSQVVYSLRTFDSEKGEYQYKLWSVTEDRQQDSVQLTRGDSKDTYPQISPDGKWLGFISDRPPRQNDDESEFPEQQLYVLPLAGGEAMLATDELGEVHDFAFAADGSGVFVIVDVKESPYERYMRESAEEDKRDVTHEERGHRPKRICFISLPSLEVETVYQRDYGLQQLTVSQDGRFVIFVTNYTGLANDGDACDLWLLARDADGHFDKAVPLVQRKGACIQPAVSPDGTQVAFVAPRGDYAERSQSDLWIVNLATGHTHNITEASGWIGDVQDVTWAGAGELVAAVEKGLYAPLVRFVNDRTADGGWTVSYITEETAVVHEFALAANRRIAYLADTVDAPEDVYVTQLDGAPAQPWTDLHADMRDLPRARVDAFTWTSFDGWPMEGVLVLPNESVAGTGPYPLIVDIHGGPAWHTTRSYHHYLNYHWLASLGYAVFSPNYRGGIGYGQAYIEANHRDLGGGDYKDIMAGVDAVVATGWVDSARMGLTGGSYGGYMTNWIIGHDDRFGAAVSEFGIWSLLTDFGCSSQRVWEVMYLGRYWENESLYLERSPSRYVQHVHTPVLIIHGDADDNTFPANSREMYNALLEAGKTVEFVHYPREGHGVSEPRHRIDELQRIGAWFEHYVPTNLTQSPVALGVTANLPTFGLQASVTAVRDTDDYAAYGEDYERLIEINLTLVKSDSDDTDKVVELHADHPATADLRLLAAANEPHQRTSIFATESFAPQGIALAGMMLTGDFVLRIREQADVQLLFSADALSYAQWSELQFCLAETRFQLA